VYRAGSGLVGRAAKALGRKAVLIDIEEQYCQIAERMCTQEVMDLDPVDLEAAK